jgi:hypothetical protein
MFLMFALTRVLFFWMSLVMGAMSPDVSINTCDDDDVCFNAFHVFDVCIITREMAMMFV